MTIITNFRPLVSRDLLLTSWYRIDRETIELPNAKKVAAYYQDFQ